MNLFYSLVVGVSMFTSGSAVQYAPLSGADLDGLILTTIEAEIGYGPFYGRTEILTSMFPSGGRRLNFSPQDNTYVIGGGLRLGWIDIGIEHECWHPMVAYQWVGSRSQVIPSYEGGATRVYAMVKIESQR